MAGGAERDRWAAAIASVAIAIAGALAFAWPVLRDLQDWGIHDWDYHTAHLAVPRASILEHGQLPLWNPYNWSGVPLLANPESRVLSPTFLLTLALGEVVAVKLEILLFVVVGLLGAERLLRSHGASRVASLLGATVFAFNGWYAVQLVVGHVWALNIAYLPWLMLFHRRAQRDWRNVVPAAGTLVLMLFGGGTYPLVIALLLLAISVAARALFERQGRLRELATLAATGTLFSLLGAIKLLPCAELLLAYPRPGGELGGYAPGALARALFDRTQALAPAFAARPQDFSQGIMHEGLYLGILPALLFGCGLLAQRRRAAPMALGAALLLWLSLGSRVWPSAWSALHALPILDSTRVPERLAVGAVLPIAVLAGLGLDALVRALARRGAGPRATRGVAVALVLLCAGDSIAVGSRVLRDAFTIAPLHVRRAPVFRQYGQAPPYDALGPVTARSSSFTSTSSGLYPAFLANRGSTRGYLILPAPSRAVPARSPAYRGEVFLDQDRGRADYLSWSPNRLEIALEVEAADHLVVNQNFDPGWQVESPRGREIESRRGLLAVAVSPEDRQLTLRYRPRSVVIGAWVSGLALLGTALGVWRVRRPAAVPRCDRIRHTPRALWLG